MKSSFGNYVIQKALKITINEYKSKLVQTILNNIEKLSEKKLITKWNKIVENSLNDNQDLDKLNNNKNNFKNKNCSAKNVNMNINIDNNQNNSIDNCQDFINANTNINKNRNNFLNLNFALDKNIIRSFSGSPSNLNKTDNRHIFMNNTNNIY